MHSSRFVYVKISTFLEYLLSVKSMLLSKVFSAVSLLCRSRGPSVTKTDFENNDTSSAFLCRSQFLKHKPHCRFEELLRPNALKQRQLVERRANDRAFYRDCNFPRNWNGYPFESSNKSPRLISQKSFIRFRLYRISLYLVCINSNVKIDIVGVCIYIKCLYRKK